MINFIYQLNRDRRLLNEKIFYLRELNERDSLFLDFKARLFLLAVLSGISYSAFGHELFLKMFELRPSDGLNETINGLISVGVGLTLYGSGLLFFERKRTEIFNATTAINNELEKLDINTEETAYLQQYPQI